MIAARDYRLRQAAREASRARHEKMIEIVQRLQEARGLKSKDRARGEKKQAGKSAAKTKADKVVRGRA